MKNTPYVSAIGSTMYAMVCTRPNIENAVEVVSKFMSNPSKALGSSEMDPKVFAKHGLMF